MKAAAYAKATKAESAFVCTNSICQGRIVPLLWPKIFEAGSVIRFAHTSFKWANLASHNAGVTVAIVGLSTQTNKKRQLYDLSREGEITVRDATNITPYLTIGENIVVSGPFILDKEEFKQYKIFKKNPKYFNASKVRLEKIKTIMVEDYNANLNAYQTGQHDWSFASSLPT